MDYSSANKDYLTKLPPPVASVERKPYPKQISSINRIPIKHTIQWEEPGSNQAKVGRVLINRSISSSLASVSRFELPVETKIQLHTNPSFDRLAKIATLKHDLYGSNPRLPPKLKQFNDYNSSSSGYDSNESSSYLSHFPLNSVPQRGVIRRVPSVHYIYPQQNSDSSISLSSDNRFKRYSCNEPYNIKNDVINSLDKIDKRVAFFCEVAIELCDEKQKLLDSLKQVDSLCTPESFSEVDLKDIQATADNLLKRLANVEITMNTVRTQKQVDAFNQTNDYIDTLNKVLQKDGKMAAKQRCLSYISSCSSDDLTDSNNNQIKVPIDERFQKLIIGCTLSDQKLLKKKLTTILSNIEVGRI